MVIVGWTLDSEGMYAKQLRWRKHRGIHSRNEPDVPFLQPSFWIVVIQPTSATTKPNLLCLSVTQAVRWLGSFDGSFRIPRVFDDSNILSPAYLRLDCVLFLLNLSLPASLLLCTFHSHLGAEY